MTEHHIVCSALPCQARASSRTGCRRSLSLLALGLVVIHVITTAFDAMGDSWRTVLWINGWAKNWPAANFAYNIGVIAFYWLDNSSVDPIRRRGRTPRSWVTWDLAAPAHESE
jgi:hypothetical protein